MNSLVQMKIEKLNLKYPGQRQILNELSQNLNDAVRVYQKLLQLASEIQEALFSDKIEQILVAASQQTKLARALQEHEKIRMAVIEKVGTSFSLPSETLSLSHLISLAPEPYATNYAILRNKLQLLISKLDSLCFQNARLISSNIEYVDGMLGILTNLSKDSDSTYLCTGRIGNSQYKAQILDYSF
jgi:hypothetical protein